jgi:hypothetical protein
VTRSFSLLNGNTTDEAQTTAYLYEYPTSIIDAAGDTVNASEFSVNRQHIILKKAGTPATYYYRLDFYDHAT